MNQDSILLHKRIHFDDSVKEKFDIDKIIASLRSEHYKIFKKPVDLRLIKSIVRMKSVWRGDEYLMFETICHKTFENKITCPKCLNVDYFLPSRHSKIIKMMEIQKPVWSELPRTANCQHCSFSINPSAWEIYRNIKTDLRKYILYLFITDDCRLSYPVASLSRILDVSYGTAKRIIKLHTQDDFKTALGEKYVKRLFKNRNENDASNRAMALISNYEHKKNVGFDSVLDFKNNKK